MKKPLHLLILFAFLMQAMIPLGFMPNLSADGVGKTALVICSGLDQKTIYVDDSGKPVDPHQSGHAKPCAFSVATSFDHPGHFATLTHGMIIVSTALHAPEAQLFAQAPHLRPQAIGPPAVL